MLVLLGREVCWCETVDISYYDLFVIKGIGRLRYGANNNKEVVFMSKKANKPNITININVLSNIRLDGKSILVIIAAIICFALVMSICNSSIRAELIRVFISMIRDC